MAMTFHWLGGATKNSATVCVRGETNGAITLSCAAGAFTAVCDTAVNDGVAVINVTELGGGQQYDFTLIDAAGSTLSGSLRTLPARFGKVAFISCLDRLRAVEDLAQNIIAFGADAVQHQGDYIYVAAALSGYNMETSVAAATSTTVAGYADHWRQCKRKSDMRLLETALPSFYTFDDHEFGGDNWDHSVAQAQTALNVASGGTQAEVDESWWKARQALGFYHAGNPANASHLAVPEKPALAGESTPASNYPINYYSYVAGDIEVFVLDCISYRSALTATDNAAKTQLGINQKAWLKAALAASTATWKVIASGKTTYCATAAGTGDDWLKYTTERDELIDYINTNASGNLRGLVWLCGDAHAPFVAYDSAKGHIAVCANPAGVNRIAQSAGYSAKVVWKEQGKSATAVLPVAVFGLVEAFDGYLVLRLINEYGAEMWRGRVNEGTNVLLMGA